MKSIQSYQQYKVGIAQLVERLHMEQESSIRVPGTSQVKGRDWLGGHTSCQEVGRCHSRGKSQRMCNMYTSAKCK